MKNAINESAFFFSFFSFQCDEWNDTGMGCGRYKELEVVV